MKKTVATINRNHPSLKVFASLFLVALVLKIVLPPR